MKHIFIIIAFVNITTILSAQPKADNIKASLKALGFYTDWQLAGIPGGIPNATDVFKTLDAGATAEQINKAIQDAGDAVQASGGTPANLRVVQLKPGVFDVGATDIVLNKSGVILRGSGNSTIVRGTNSGNGVFVIGNTSNSWQEVVDLIVAAKVGDNTITVANGGAFKANQILKLDRLADDVPADKGGAEWHNNHFQFQRGRGGEYGPAASPTDSRTISQYVEVESVNGNVLTLKNRININFPLQGADGKQLYPQVWNTNAHNCKYTGLENLKIEATGTTAGGNAYHVAVINVVLSSSYSWVKNIESDGRKFNGDNGFKGRHIELNGFRNHVTGNYVHHSSQVSPGGQGYGIRWHGSDCIIDNNICDFLNKTLLGQTSNGGNVIAYNYVPNAVIAPWNNGAYIGAAYPGNPQEISDWIETAIDPSHGGISHSDLFEGNFSANIHTDGTSGNGLFVMFRNHSWGRNVGGRGPTGIEYGMEHFTSGSLNGINVAGGQFQHASIGNVYLNPVTVASRAGSIWNGNGIAVYRFGTDTMRGSGLDGVNSQKFSMDRFYWAYDYNYRENKIEPSRAAGTTVCGIWTVPDSNLPASLYLTTAPDYFSGYSWPPVNPFGRADDERVGGLPARDRYNDRVFKRE